MTGVAKRLRATDERWAELSSGSVWSAAAIVAVAWGLIAMNRLGGLTLTDPRAFVRLTVVGVWGWLALGASLWVLVRVSARARASDAPARSAPPLASMLCVVGWAHMPIVALAIVVFIAAGALQLLGPGLAVALAVFTLVVPFALVTGVRHVADSSILQAALTVAIPYSVWMLIVTRHELDSIQHLL